MPLVLDLHLQAVQPQFVRALPSRDNTGEFGSAGSLYPTSQGCIARWVSAATGTLPNHFGFFAM